MMNEYRILEKMATGSFGVVFKVRRLLDDSVLVMKRIALTDLDAQQRKDAAQEVRVMSRLHHPFIVAQRDAFLFNDSLCIVMDYYDGGDLAALITRQREKDEYFSLEQVMLWFAEVNMAIHYLHTHGIVHRDLKTHNLFLVRDSKEVAVGDFGVAEFVDPAEGGMPKKSPFLPTLSPASQRIFAKRRDSELFGGEGSAADGMNGAFGGAVRGTLLYMAPEVLETGVCSPSSDVWALGCILYELLNLYHPFESRDVAALMMRVMAGVRQPLSAHYPAEITELVDHMLALDAKQRPSCEEILRSPMMSPYVRQIVRRRALCELDEEEAERVWEEQLQTLGINKSALSTHLPLIREKQPAMPPSQARVMSEKFAVMSPGSDFQLSPRTSTFGDESVVTPHFAHPMRLGHEYHSPLSHANNYSGLSEREREDNDQSSGGGGLFFPSWGSGITNVEDMLNMPLELVEAEVERYRQLVQNEMREQKRRRDAAKYKKRFGENTTPTMQYYNNLLQVEQVNSKSPVKSCIDHKVEDGGSVPPFYSSFSVSSHLPSGSSRRLESICMSSGKWPQGSLEASLTTRRQQRIGSATQVLDFAAFREFQARSSILAEKERSVDLRRRLLQDAAQSVQGLSDECRRREEQLQQERHRIAQRRAQQDEKVGAKEAQGRAQQERVAALDAEETRLRTVIAEREEAMRRVHDELQQRKALAANMREAKEGLMRLKCQLEERDAKMMKLETRVAKMEMAAEKRHAVIADRLPSYDMPRIEAERSTGLEETAGESILLIDEFNQ